MEIVSDEDQLNHFIAHAIAVERVAPMQAFAFNLRRKQFQDIRVRKTLEKRLIHQNENLEKIVRERTEDLENQKNLLIRKNQELTTLTEKLRENTHRAG